MINASLLACPEDRVPLEEAGKELRCPRCHRGFPLHSESLVEVMPRAPRSRSPRNALERNNVSIYLRKTQEPFRWLSNPEPWAALETLPSRERARVGLQSRIIADSLPRDLGDFCDVSVGSGRHSIPLIERARSAVLCDMSVDDLNYVHRQAARDPKVMLVRCDYLQSPFREAVFDTLLCNDTLIYGEDHESLLLAAIHAMLRPGGTFLGDFKCKWHTHPIRGPYMIHYSWRQVRAMVEAAGFSRHRMIPYYQEEAKGRRGWIRLLLPPTRYFVLAEK